MNLPTLPASEPIYVIGDSHCLLFRYLTVDAPEYLARPLVTVPVYVPNLSAGSIMQDGKLNEGITQALQSCLAITLRKGRWRRFDADRPAIPDIAAGRYVADSPHDVMNVGGSSLMLFTAGSLDVGEVMREIGPETDFAFDDPRYVAERFEGPELAYVPVAFVERAIAKRLAPFADAFRAMDDMGFGNVYVRSLLPPIVDDVRFYRYRNVMCSAKVRTKVTLLMNRELRRLAEEAGARYLDLWDACSSNGILDAQLHFDGDHLNKRGAELTLSALLDDVLIRRGRPIPDEVRFDFWRDGG